MRHRLHLVDAQRLRAGDGVQRDVVSEQHLLHRREPGVACRRHHWQATREEIRVLRRAVPGRDVHYPHAPRQSLLRRQPHFALPPHLLHLIPRLLPAGRVRREGQPRDDHSAGARRLSADGWRDDAAHSRLHSNPRYAHVFSPAQILIPFSGSGLLLQMSHVAWSVCPCIGHTGDMCKKRPNRSRCRFGALTYVGSRNHVLHGDPDPPREGHF